METRTSYNIMDSATRKHLIAWLPQRCRTQEEQDLVLPLMVARYLEDPDIWGSRGWPQVYDSLFWVPGVNGLVPYLVESDALWRVPGSCSMCGGEVLTDDMGEYDQTVMLLDNDPRLASELICDRCTRLRGADLERKELARTEGTCQS